MKIIVKGISETLAEINFKISEVKQKEINKASEKLLNNLRTVTPVDTGNARDGWRLLKNKESFTVYNKVKYINKLNRGSSLQAPSYFIEREALKIGRPYGSITESIE